MDYSTMAYVASSMEDSVAAGEALGNLMGLAILGLFCWWIWSKIDAGMKRSKLERDLSEIKIKIEMERLEREKSNFTVDR